MTTTVHLNEWTQLVINLQYSYFADLIEENNDKGANFIEVPCEKIMYSDEAYSKIEWKKFKLYIKRILFFYES